MYPFGIEPAVRDYDLPRTDSVHDSTAEIFVPRKDYRALQRSCQRDLFTCGDLPADVYLRLVIGSLTVGTVYFRAIHSPEIQSEKLIPEFSRTPPLL